MTSKPPGTNNPYQPVPEIMDSWLPWLQRVSRATNMMLYGKQNVVLDQITLDINADSTTVKDSRIGTASYIGLMPMTQDAADSNPWVSSQQVGQATITHENQADTTRTFRLVIFG